MKSLFSFACFDPSNKFRVVLTEQEVNPLAPPTLFKVTWKFYYPTVALSTGSWKLILPVESSDVFFMWATESDPLKGWFNSSKRLISNISFFTSIGMYRSVSCASIIICCKPSGVSIEKVICSCVLFSTVTSILLVFFLIM